MPIRRVVLYKNGVGFFEHLGRVRGNQDIHIDFTSGQLNDALASLTVLDLDGGRIGDVSYNSRQRRWTGASEHCDYLSMNKPPFPNFGRAARLAVGGGQRTDSVSGRLLSVERKTRTAGGTTL